MSFGLRWANKSYPTFVSSFKILGSEVPEKSLTKKKVYTRTQTHTQLLKRQKTIYPLYTSYTGGINMNIEVATFPNTNIEVATFDIAGITCWWLTWESFVDYICFSPCHSHQDSWWKSPEIHTYFMLICLNIMDFYGNYLSQLMRLWYLSHRRPAKAQASLRIYAVSPEPSLFAHMKYGSRRRLRPKIRHLAPPDGCACVFEELVYGGRKVPDSHELAHLVYEATAYVFFSVQVIGTFFSNQTATAPIPNMNQMH